jgi:anaerobic selenocysteine-containing dehydrogenase
MVDEIEAGHLRGVVVHGGNPLAAFPDTVRTRRALQSLDLLVAVDVISNEFTEIATHVVAATSMLERADLSMRERGCYTPALVAIGGNRRPAWWAYAQVARRIGLDVLDGQDPDHCDDESVLRQLAANAPDRFETAKAAGPRGAVAPPPVGWVRDRALPNRRWRLAPAVVVDRLPNLLSRGSATRLTFINRRQAKAVNSSRYIRPKDEFREQPDILVHPDDAARFGVASGQRVRLRNSTGTLEGVARVDERIRRGVVSVPNGWADVNVNHLISRVDDVDDLTGQPRISALDVELDVTT